MADLDTPARDRTSSQRDGPRRSIGIRVARTVRHALPGATGGVAGLAPHVLHHVGLLAGTAVVAGSGGTLLFAVLGLVASVPTLRRLHRRFRTWWAPALGLAVFAVMFAVSAFVVGPQISGQSSSTPAPAVQHDDTHGHDPDQLEPGSGAAR